MAFDTWKAPKDPDAVRDFGINWAKDIGTATISSSEWTVVSGAAVVDSDIFDDTTTTARISGGVDGSTCIFNNHIVLSDGQEDDKTCRLKIVSQ